jgi:hypothetical protein
VRGIVVGGEWMCGWHESWVGMGMVWRKVTLSNRLIKYLHIK